MIGAFVVDVFILMSSPIVSFASHTMLKNTSSQVFKALMKVETRRRICLTGSPFQNNLSEYFRMVSYVRPGLLGKSEIAFQKDFAEPIEAGMASDARQNVKEYADELLVALSKKLQPHVHRRDSTVLLADLPSLQQVCLHVKPTKVQRVLYAAYRKVQTKDATYKNFLKQYSNLRSIHNHPGTLLIRSEIDPKSCARHSPLPVAASLDDSVTKANSDKVKETARVKEEEDTKAKEEKNSTLDDAKPTGRISPDPEEIVDLLSDSEPEETKELSVDENSWWKKAVDKLGVESLNDAGSSNKFVLLLHLLCHANSLGEKTVLFTQCLKVRTLLYVSALTLEFISH